jgi:hypothetical protein
MIEPRLKAGARLSLLPESLAFPWQARPKAAARGVDARAPFAQGHELIAGFGGAGAAGSARPDVHQRSGGSEGGSDQLCNTVSTQDDRGKAARDHREKKGGCDGVFHGRPSN